MRNTEDAQTVLFGPAGRRSPAVALVFDGGDAFRYGMGAELAEHSAPFRDPVAVHDSIMETPLEELLWYRPAGSPEVDDTQRLAAVLTVGVGTGRVFRYEHEVEVAVTAGRGVGYVAAAVAAGVLALDEALHWIAVDRLTESAVVGRATQRLDGQRLGRPPICFGSADDLIGALRRVNEISAVVDLGPGDAVATDLRAASSVTVPVGSWDSPIDRLAIRDKICRRTFFSAAYLVERTLGQLASTRALPTVVDDHTRITEAGRRLKALLRTQLPTSIPMSDRGAVVDAVRETVTCWVTNGLAKGYSAHEIVESLVALEHETLLRLRAAFGISERHLYPGERSGIHRAS